ncbi:MAG TPA: arginine--tRNA ligase [Bryobacteraceae bacterium]|jgi:arginyl-tRNA synthetase|nr:arginine--tRNA ligase [Bryobacteraceae bacterium]
MFQQIEANLIDAVEQALQPLGANVKVTLEQPKQGAFGELAIPIAFQLARTLKRSPKSIAEEIVERLPKPEGVSSYEIAGNGYINVRLDRGTYAAALVKQPEAEPPPSAEKIIVEHTAINPNKAAHIGHLRNAILGDTFVRMLRGRGHRVEVQNYIDNTGVQVADVVVGFHFLEKKTPSEVRALIEDPAVRFDYLCWDLYAQTSAYYSKDPDALQWRAETLHAVESGQGELAEMGHLVADAIVEAHLRTMYRLSITYELLARESEILHLQFWAAAFELLKQRKAIYFESQGKNRGCWVMPSTAFRDSAAHDEEDSKVIVRSNGTVTYVGKDIAYQLWKFGLLGKDFYYRPWSTYPNGSQVWVTTDQPSRAPTPRFGAASKVFTVIDSKQSYLQDVVVAGFRALGFEQQADALIHFSYEVVALSPRTCVELGIELSEEDKRRTHVEVSGRKGLGVKADDLIDKLSETALAEVEHRHAEADPAERQSVAKQIAVGALRYFMLKFTRNSVIAFDFHEALSFEGETGPYVQYAAVRAANILRKLAERGEEPPVATAMKPEVLARCLETEGLWQLLLLASKSGSAIERAIASGEPAHVAKYAFQLAQAFNIFYHEHSVIAEPDPERRNMLVWLTGYVRNQLAATLEVLGIEQPKYM